MAHVYQIECSVSNKVYFGQSDNYLFRLGQHFRDLRKKKHVNKNLQEDYNKHGEASFTWKLISDECDKRDAKIKEAGLIFKSACNKSSYNIMGVSGTQGESRKKGGSKLQEYLLKKKLTYKDFAAMVGVTPMTVIHWLNGRSQPKQKNMPRLIAAVTNGEVTIADFYD